MLQYSWKAWVPKRGEIYLVDLGDTIDSEMAGLRPFLILSNDIGNKNASIVSGLPLSTRNKPLPIHVSISRNYGLRIDSYALTEHIRSVSKRRFCNNDMPKFVGKLSKNKMKEIERAIMIQLGMTS